MTKIQNSNIWVIEYWDLRFICNLPARRLSGGLPAVSLAGVLEICDF